MSLSVGILGTGQLGRMLAQAASSLGVKIRFLPFGDTSACEGLGEIVSGNPQSRSVQERFISGMQVVTYEWENVPLDLVKSLRTSLPVHPNPLILERTQDRLDEKNFLRSLEIPTAPFLDIPTEADLELVEPRLGFPCVLKTRRFGYDGKGQGVARNLDQAKEIFRSLKGSGLIAEGFVQFRRELSIVAVCAGKETLAYPLVENSHHEGILRVTRAPADNIEEQYQLQAESFAQKVIDAVGYRGVLCLELFETDQGLVVNELAPRVHNSGHWTLDGATPNQFESHIRAVLGLPLPELVVKHRTAMVNFIGSIENLTTADPALRQKCILHDYHKADKPGRKVGHVNITGSNKRELEQALNSLQKAYPNLFPAHP